MGERLTCCVVLMFELSDGMVTAVVERLGVVRGEPDRARLDGLMWRYTQVVPWESALRIARRAALPTADCPRTAVQFWQDHLERGTGGTCFESNLALWGLLQALGYEGYLTINNMGTTSACHTAIVIVLEGEKWLVDASAVTGRETAVLTFSARPVGPFAYQPEFGIPLGG